MGLGILSAASKLKIIKETDEQNAIELMCRVNSIGASFGKLDYVTAMTDMTGFGLLGHLVEVAKGSKVSIKLFFDTVPKINGIDDYSKTIETDGGKRNWRAYKGLVNNLSKSQRVILSDPQTNGGLLVFIRPENKEDFEQFLKKHNLQRYATPIGKVCKYNANNNLVLVN